MASPLRRVSGYTWDAGAGRYRGPSGRFVSRGTIRRVVDRALEATQRRMIATAERLRRGEITLSEWQRLARDDVKSVHLYSSAAAKGGWAQMSPADYGRVGAELRKQYTYLDRFAGEIEAGLPLDGRFLRRVQLYAQAGRGTFHRTERDLERARGMTEERNILGVADHCPGCLTETARGWVAIGTLVPVGQRTCLSLCKCSVAYR